MGLPEDYNTGTLNDAKRRFEHSIIVFDNEPIYIASIKHDDKGKKQVFGTTNGFQDKVNVPLDDPRLSIVNLGGRLGYFNFTDTLVGRLARIPLNSTAQGLTRNNILEGVYHNGRYLHIYSPSPYYKSSPFNLFEALGLTDGQTQNIYEKGSSYNIRYEVMAALMSKGFINSFSGKFPDIEVVLDKTKPHSTVVDRRIILERDNFGDVYVVYCGDKVGKMSKDRIKYLDNKAYLTQEVERRTGLKAI